MHIKTKAARAGTQGGFRTSHQVGGLERDRKARSNNVQEDDCPGARLVGETAAAKVIAAGALDPDHVSRALCSALFLDAPTRVGIIRGFIDRIVPALQQLPEEV